MECINNVDAYMKLTENVQITQFITIFSYFVTLFL